MPIYEFICQKCHTKTNVFVKNISVSFTPVCSVCGSKDLIRTVSRFAYHKSIETIHEEAGEPRLSPGPDYYKDPRNIGRWTEKKFEEMGKEMPAELKGEIQAAREGELPKELKEKLEA